MYVLFEELKQVVDPPKKMTVISEDGVCTKQPILVHTFQDSQLKPITPHATHETKSVYESEEKKIISLVIMKK